MLVGREPERRVLERLLAGARAGSSAALVITGEPGIGKTSLIAEAAALATGMRVLRAAGAPSERDLPFAGLSQLLPPLLPLLDRIPEPQAAALASALALRPGQHGERFAVAAATLSLVCRAAEDTPLLVVVDDLQQLDRPSADALLFVARRLLTDAVAMLFGVRTDSEHDDLVTGLERLHLSGLAVEDARRLVADHGLTETQLRRLHDLTAGNPLALLEMSARPDRLDDHRGVVPVPRLIVRAFAEQVAGLGRPTQAVLRLAATADLDLATLARACAIEGVGLDELAEAERSELVTVEPDRVRFRHPLLRAAVQQAADPLERRAAHRAVAEALDKGDLDRRAWHLSEATLGPDAGVSEIVERAADSALSRGAFAVAAGGFERSARLSPGVGDRVRRLTLAGEASWLGGESERATALLNEAAHAAPGETARARAKASQGVVAARAGALDVARDLLLSAAEAQADDADEATLVLAEAAYACFYLGDGHTLADVVRKLDDLEPRVRSERARLLRDLASGMGLIMVGRGDEGVLRLRRVVAAAADGALSGDARWMPWLMLGPLWLRETGEARGLVDEVVREARERVAVGTLPFLLFHAARDDATTDRWAAAEAGFREAVDLAGETGQRTDAGISLAGLAWLMARQGREAEARATAEQAAESCDRSRLHLGRAWIGYALGDLEAGLGHPAAALAHYRAQQELVAGLGLVDPDLSPSAEVVECLARLGEDADAVRAARASAAAATAKGQPWARARGHRALAVAGIEPDVHFERALTEHGHTLDVYERARTELAFGVHLRRQHRPSEARPHLRAAVAVFDRLGARPWAEAASTELTATGERVQRRSGEGTQRLTPQEFRIARLLAEGGTTRAAAAALFLSPKTVEYHLRHVYIKLGITSRRELADRVAADPELRAEAGPRHPD